MAVLGSAEWLEDWRDPLAASLVAERAEVGPLRVQYVVTGGPDGEVRFGTVVAGGAATAVVGEVADPDVTLTTTFAEALAVVSGQVSPNVSYMRGRTKAVGHTGQLLRLLAAGQGPAYDEARADLASRTDPA